MIIMIVVVLAVAALVAGMLALTGPGFERDDR